MAKMGFFDHLDELRDSLIWILATVGVLSIFFFTFRIDWFAFTFRIDWFAIGSRSISLPYPCPSIFDSISVNFFRSLTHSLLPPDVESVVMSPTDAVIVSLQTSFFLGLLFGMPMVVYQLGKFLSPALYPHERQMLLKMALPASALFAGGTLFAYFIILPIWLNVLYFWAGGLGATKFINVRILLSFVIKIFIAYGIIFELPAIQAGLTKLGAVSADFWRSYWRWAVVIIIIVSAIITPADVLTLAMVSGPMISLYFAGYVFSRKIERKKG